MHNTFKYTTEANTFQHIHMFIIIHKTNTVAKIYTHRILILRISCLETNYVAIMFHPTTCQCAHQYLNTISTLNLGMISTRN